MASMQCFRGSYRNADELFNIRPHPLHLCCDGNTEAFACDSCCCSCPVLTVLLSLELSAVPSSSEVSIPLMMYNKEKGFSFVPGTLQIMSRSPGVGYPSFPKLSKSKKRKVLVSQVQNRIKVYKKRLQNVSTDVIFERSIKV